MVAWGGSEEVLFHGTVVAYQGLFVEMGMFVLHSPDHTPWELSVDNSGNVKTRRLA
jgi:hypothetical protein